jgi:hypothetical protein
MSKIIEKSKNSSAMEGGTFLNNMANSNILSNQNLGNHDFKNNQTKLILVGIKNSHDNEDVDEEDEFLESSKEGDHRSSLLQMQGLCYDTVVKPL